jgi:hypothetical protein
VSGTAYFNVNACLQKTRKLSSYEPHVPATPVTDAEQTPATLADQQGRDLAQPYETIRTVVKSNIRAKGAQTEEKAKEETPKTSKAHEQGSIEKPSKGSRLLVVQLL